MKKIIVLTAALSVILFSCKKNKDDDPNPTNKSTTELLTAHGWKLQSSTANKDVDVTDDDTDNKSSDVYAQRKGCETDDIITFTTASDGTKTGTKGVGSTKCGSESDVPFTWSLSNGDTKLTLTALIFYSTDYTILSIDDNTLKVVYDAKDENDTDYSATDVYKKP